MNKITLEKLVEIKEAKGEETKYTVIDCVSKSRFVKEISKVLFTGKDLSIDNVELKFFYNEKKNWLEEMVVMTYTGGGIAVKNNSCNSVSATYKVIGDLINGGYYDENKGYYDIQNDPDWVEVVVFNE